MGFRASEVTTEIRALLQERLTVERLHDDMIIQRQSAGPVQGMPLMAHERRERLSMAEYLRRYVDATGTPL